MSDFEAVRLIILRALAHLHAADEAADESIEPRRAAERALRGAQMLMRRVQLASVERDELLELLANARRLLTTSPRPRAA